MFEHTPATPMTDIEQALHTALPASLHARIPVLAQVLVTARDGQDACVATPDLIEALKQLQGQTLTVANGSITVQNISGETIAIGQNGSIFVAHALNDSQRRATCFEKSGEIICHLRKDTRL